MRRGCEPDSAWEAGYGLGVGHAGQVSDRPSRRRRRPVGFYITKPKRKPRKR